MPKRKQWLQSGILMAICVAVLAPAMALADPVITGFSNDQVPLNGFVTIYGSGFGDAQGLSYVLVGGQQVPVQAWSAVAIHILMNPLAYNQSPVALDAAYPVQVVLRADGKTSNAVNLTITSGTPPVVTPVAAPGPSDQPSIIGFQKSQFCAGNDIAISGAGFGDAAGQGYVSITVPFLDSHGNPFTQEFAIPILGWSENAINVLLVLPDGAQLGAYTLTVHRSNGKTASAAFSVGMCP